MLHRPTTSKLLSDNKPSIINVGTAALVAFAGVASAQGQHGHTGHGGSEHYSGIIVAAVIITITITGIVATIIRSVSRNRTIKAGSNYPNNKPPLVEQ